MTTEIKSRIIGNLGHITLNRPKALNALTYAMCEEITRLLVAWEKDKNIGAVLIDGAGDRAFCAGGDVILLHETNAPRISGGLNMRLTNLFTVIPNLISR